MKKRLILTTTVIAIAALSIVPFVYAGPGRHAHGEGFGGGHGFGIGVLGHLAQVKEELGLSDQQVDQLKAIFADAHQQNAQYRDQMHSGMKDIVQALLKDPNDVAGAQAILDQQTDAERVLKANILQATSKALNVLNADQRDRLSTMIAERAGQWERRRQ
jgi:Spy/CpxP family protein refolding chaperone